MTAGAPVPVAYDDAPLRRFHLRVAAASTGGVFSDGFGLGIIGIALTAATPDLGLTPVWLGLLGGGSLAGLFAGALLTGPFADRFGRRPVFAANMALLAVLSALQFFVASSGELLALRLAIGFVLGTDYVVSKALLTEFTPRLLRGPIMSLLSVAWAAGYACAFLVGFLLTSGGTDAWRWMLLAGAVPCMLVLPFRLTIPESPLWLVDHGHAARAADVVAMIAGPFVRPPARGVLGADRQGRWQQLFTSTWRRRTLVGCAFFTCQVIPYFAVGTFVSRVIAAINGGGGYLGGLVYNLALLCGAILGLLTIDRMPRRTFLLLSFVLPAGAMLALVVARNLPPAAVIVLFAAFAGVLSAASNLVYVYLPELFPTDLRASGIGLAIASSRVGSAISTFLLPVLMADSGVRTALGVCVGVLVLGAIVCHVWAPETRRIRLSVVAPDAAVATRP